MVSRYWFALSLAASLAASLPDVKFTLPKGGEIFKGGEPLEAAWQFSGNDTFVPPSTNFLQMIINPSGDATVVHSERFGFSSLTGKFPNRISDILFHLHPTVTQAPTIPPSIGELLKRQAGEPFARQTGETKYAPAPKQPGTKITKSSVKPQHSTSSYSIASMPLDDATIKTTISASATFSTKSIENTAKAAGNPTDGPQSADNKNKRGEEDEMLKLLRRWAD
ncbi:hypothetical protein KEM56_005947 [Ascosphaera pollenicola]|nr:hypothetical protein KEM56_005947 [Ascosphaera pollenicola]